MRLIGVGDLRNGVYYLKNKVEATSLVAIRKQEAGLWHQHLRHPSYGSLSVLSQLYSFELNKGLGDGYDICHRAKQTHNSFPLSNSKAIRPCELIH